MKNSPGSKSLREKAEEKLKSGKKQTFLNEFDAQKLIHELEVHQIELEMQNMELRESEERSRKATEKYTSLYDFAPMGYFTLDQDCRIKNVNLSGALLVGTERYLLQNIDFRTFISPEYKDTFNDFFEKISGSETKKVCKLKLKRADQSFVVVHAEGVVSNDTRECSLTLLDITQREVAEEKRHVSELRYRRLFESAKGGIAILDYTGRIVDVNPFLIGLLGYPYEEFIGKELWEMGLFSDADDFKKSLRELHIKEYSHVEDMPLKTKSGSHINVEIVSNVYKIGNDNVIQCNIRDITKKRLAEEKLKEYANQLRELNATKDKFFSIIAHDLRSPFTAIIGYTELLDNQIENKNYKKIGEYANIIRSSSWLAMDLLTNLLEWARSQIGIMKFRPQNFEISELVNDTKNMLSPSANKKSIDIKVLLPDKLTVYADKLMIKTTLRNLISNAIKFTNPGGTILI
jgi:PAS domain S-box-containing protein